MIDILIALHRSEILIKFMRILVCLFFPATMIVWLVMLTKPGQHNWGVSIVLSVIGSALFSMAYVIALDVLPAKAKDVVRWYYREIHNPMRVEIEILRHDRINRGPSKTWFWIMAMHRSDTFWYMLFFVLSLLTTAVIIGGANRIPNDVPMVGLVIGSIVLGDLVSILAYWALRVVWWILSEIVKDTVIDPIKTAKSKLETEIEVRKVDDSELIGAIEEIYSDKQNR